MFKRGVLLPLGLLVFVFCLAGPGLSDSAAQLDQAKQLQDEGQLEQAEAIYKAVAEADAGGNDGLAAQEKLAILYVEQGKQAQAQAAYLELLSGYSQLEGIAQAVDHVADAYREWGQYEQALAVYQDVVTGWGGAEHSVGSQSWIARIYIQLGDEPNTAVSIEKLLRDFSEHDGLGTAVHDVGYTYHHTARRYDKARELYEWVVENRPDDSQAIRAQMGMAKIYIVCGDDPNAEAAIDKLIADYSQDEEGIAKALDHIGDKYRKVGEYEKAKQIYELVVTRWANTEYAENSRMGLAKAIIEASISDRDDEAVESEIESLVADFNDNELLAKALFQLGEKYHRWAFVAEQNGYEERAKENFASAAAVWDRIIHMPPSKQKAQAYYFSAGCFRKVGDYERAIEYYEKVVVDWPDCDQASTSQLRIANCYRKLEEAGGIATGDAVSLMRDACEKVLTNYPDSPAVKAASDLLKRADSLQTADSQEGEEQ